MCIKVQPCSEAGQAELLGLRQEQGFWLKTSKFFRSKIHMKTFHVLEKALPEDQAQQMITKYEQSPFLLIDDKEYSTYYRQDFVDKDLSKKVYELIKDWFPNCRIGNKWYLTKYVKGGFIDFHCDGHVSIDNIRSKYTILIYLNQDYEGGELCFEEKSKVIIKPGVGTIVVMDQDLWHKANPLLSGIKYLLRADMISLNQ